MTEIEIVTQDGTLVLDPEQTRFTPSQVAALSHIGVENASDGDLQVFHHVCQRTGLDPFARQIYMIGRKSSVKQNGQWVDGPTKQTIQTGIDGFRLIGRRAANASGHMISVRAPEWAHAETGWQEIWIRAWGLPVAARVTILRDGDPFTAIALFDEYKQTKSGGDLTKMWSQRPAGQIAKCAEALAWRMAFPQDLSGIYTDDEMGQSENVIHGEVIEQVRPSGLGAALAAQNSDPDHGAHTPAEPSGASEVAAEGEQSGSESPDDNNVTAAQLRTIGRLMGKTGLDITAREEALGYVAAQVGRPVESRKDLSKSEASVLIGSLEADVALLQPTGADQ